jgi:hypothetical protein
MSRETLTSEAQYASTEQNVADEPTPVTTWTIPDGSTFTIREGHAARFIVDATGGGDVAASSRLGLGYREPNDPLDEWTVISDAPIGPFNNLTYSDQMSGDNAERRRINFDPERVPGGELVLEDSDELALLLLSPDQVDANSIRFAYPISIGES